MEINIYVFRVYEKDPLAMHRGAHNMVVNEETSNKADDTLTYSVFSITTANSSVASSQVATSKFKTFK